MHIFDKRRLDAVEWARDIQQFCEYRCPEVVSASKCRRFNVAFNLILEANKDDKEIKKMLWNEIKRTRFSVLKNKKVRKKEKIAAILSFFGESFCCLISKNLKKKM